MTRLLKKAFREARKLSEQEQDALALMLLDDFEDGGGWMTSLGGLLYERDHAQGSGQGSEASGRAAWGALEDEVVWEEEGEGWVA